MHGLAKVVWDLPSSLVKCFMLISVALVLIDNWILCTSLVCAALRVIWFERNSNIVDDASENVEVLWEKILTLTSRIMFVVASFYLFILFIF